jgi:hypothetical protein
MRDPSSLNHATKVPIQEIIYAEKPASIHSLKIETFSGGHGASGGISPEETTLKTLCAFAGTHIHSGFPRSTPEGFMH